MDWYYVDAGRRIGPIPDEEMRTLFKMGKITPDTMIWHKGLSDWQKLGMMKEAMKEEAPSVPIHWYYADAGIQTGPLSDEEMRALVRKGKITRDTLVWHSGLSDWHKFGVLEGTGPESSTATSELKTTLHEAICSQCGRPFSQDDMIRLEGSWVCPDCKPLVVQKLREGAIVAGKMEYAGFWIRFGAKLIDYIILFVVNALITFVGGILMPVSELSFSIIALQLVLALFQIAVGVSYATWFVGKYGATPGKMACRLQVVTAEGGKVSYGRACGRYFAEILSGMILLLGYIMAAFDDEKRTLHDRICDTRVIRQ